MRDSNCELLRIVAMVFIVVYHILHFYLIPYTDCAALKAACIPLHQGVILFVLISGFYGIQLSFRKIIKFIFPVAFYYVILSLFDFFINGGSIINCFLFISRSPYWFVRTYFWLLLTSPIINKYLSSTEPRRRSLVVMILGGISIWMGVTGGDPSLDGGKNLVHFWFLYGVGYSIKCNQSMTAKISLKVLFLLYAAFNILIILTFSLLLGHFVYSEVLYDWCFKYNSLVLIIDSCILFIMFSKLRFYSSVVNYIASSCFSVYLISEHHLIRQFIIAPIINYYYDSSHLFFLFLETIILAILLFLFCMLVDRLLVSRLNNSICKLFPNALIE